MFNGCYTALMTPFKNDYEVDYEGLNKLVEFQIASGVSGILAVGTTGESPTLSWGEHNEVIRMVVEKCKGKCQSIAGTGSNNTRETMESTEHAVHVGADAVLLVDPYYNGPSSLEIRREYVAPVADKFPQMQIIPYVIPGRTGAQLLPEDLAILHHQFANVSTVKEATGSIENMKRTRECCGDDFTILSGDDDKTFTMMTDPAIKASGVISVASNIAPKAVQDMTTLVNQGNQADAEKLVNALKPLFGIVTVKTQEETPYGTVGCRARNPLGAKTLMAVLGMPVGPCRQPLGKMTKKGIEVVLDAGRTVWKNNPEILKPVADFFDVDIEARLYDESSWAGLTYDEY
ncbi:MAG: 4-hydroxy-tetrahydrodipicolinate synthase [Deltaproteobacteria bacterium]|nr:4-hydroxy-tetrahydrodipicolinate synthase [Deltaproteobacteria bacterium]MBW2074188.1 4-hydroxy-tetrahydrodipicolinate synthase [Deltaproteobacteria bacterium]